MRKVYLSLFILFTSTYLFCTEPIIIKVLDYQDSSNIQTCYDNSAIWRKFEVLHPNIIIQREVLYGDAYSEKLKSYTSVSSLPDVFFMFPDDESKLLHEINCTKDLTPFLIKDGLLDKYNPHMLNSKLQPEGYLAIIPYGNGITSFTFANKKLLRELGLRPAKTYNELKLQIPVIEAAGYKPVIMANNEDWIIEASLFSMIIGRLAGPDWAPKIKSGALRFTDEPFINAVEFIEQIFKDKILKIDSFDTDIDTAIYQFTNNEAVYFIDCDYRTDAFLSNYYEEEPILPLDVQLNDIEIIDFPAIPNEILPKSNAAYLHGGFAMNSNIKEGSEKEKAAWELIKWLSGFEVQQYYMDNNIRFPSLTEGLSYAELEPLQIKRIDSYNALENYTPVFEFEFSDSLVGALKIGLHSLALGNTTPLELCRILQKYYDSGEDWWDSTDIFDTSIKNDNISDGEQLYDETLKTISGELTSISYKIRKRSDGEISIFIEDDKQEDFIIVRVSNIDQAFTMVYAIESDLNDMYKKDFWGTLVKADTPVKTVIQLLMNVDKEKEYSSWLQFSDTKEFYFNYDMR